MEEQLVAIDHDFIRDTINGAIASIKFAIGDAQDGDERLHLYNALKSLYVARVWAYRAQISASRE